jgi:hypothetical protein
MYAQGLVRALWSHLCSVTWECPFIDQFLDPETEENTLSEFLGIPAV